MPKFGVPARVMLRGSLVLVSLLCLGSACAGDDKQKPGGAAGTAGAAGAAGTGGSAGEAPCSEAPEDIPPGAVCLHEVQGRVVSAAGTPIADITTSVCGTSLCQPGKSSTGGRFAVQVGFHVPLELFSTVVHGRPSHTSFYFALPLSARGPILDVGDLTLLDLPSSGPDLVVKTDRAGAPAQNVTSGDVRLEVDAGVLVELDVEDVALGALGKQFRVVSVPPELRPRFADPALGLVSLYALMPYETAFIDEAASINKSRELRKARLAFTNTAGLPANTAVELLALGTYVYPTWVKPAAFEVVATGKVSADGAAITMDPGEGLSFLTWVGVRRKN